jgi:hypothetical protein
MKAGPTIRKQLFQSNKYTAYIKIKEEIIIRYLEYGKTLILNREKIRNDYLT